MALHRLRQFAVVLLAALTTVAFAISSTATPLRSTAPAQATPPTGPPAVQAVVGPGRALLPPGGGAAFIFPELQRDSDEHRLVAVKSMAAVPAEVTAGEDMLDVRLPTGYTPVPDAVCSFGDDLSTAICPDSFGSLPNGMVFTAADLSVADPFPIAAEVPGLGSAVLVGAPAGTGQRPPIVGLAYDPLPEGFPATTSFAAQWDGATLTVTPPDGNSIAANGAAVAICAPLDDRSTAVQCAVDGSVPELLHFTVAPLTPPRLHATPPIAFASIASPILDGRTIEPLGQPVLFAAMGTPGLAFLWDVGDGTLQPGQAVQHLYLKPGIYTARMIAVGFSAATRPPGIWSISRTTVPVGVSLLRLRYPAGWNLVGGPAGTGFSGTGAPLYFIPFPPCRAIPMPPASTATPQPVPSPVVGQPYPELPASCDTGYRTAPADHVITPAEAGQEYWVYFPQPATITIPYLVTVAGLWIMPGGRWVMIGNPDYRPVRVEGPDTVLIYDAATSHYRETTILQPGQGAWVYAAISVQLTLTPVEAPASP